MNKIALPCDYIYEFQGDKDLVRNYLTSCLDKVTFTKTIDKSTASEVGSPVVKNDKIFNWITSCINEVSKEYFKISEKVSMEISDAWLTKTDFMNTSVIHNHSLSILSGLLYLHDSDTPTIFTVEHGIGKNYSTFFGDKLTSFALTNKIKILPELGKLIIWPSYHLHQIAPNKQRQIRYTLAFNTFFNGPIGEDTTQQLNINLQGPNFL